MTRHQTPYQAEQSRLNRMLCLLLVGSLLFMLAAITALLFTAKPKYPVFHDPVTLNTAKTNVDTTLLA